MKGMKIFMGIFRHHKKEAKALKPITCAVIVAAGNSTRMGEECGSKQFIEINGIPVLVRTVTSFENAETVDEIIIVTKEEHIISVADLVKSFGFKKVSSIAKGGSTRQKSVEAGLSSIAPETEYVCIHDGARPFITPEDIDRVNEAAYKYAAAAIGVKLKDTIKMIDNDGFIINTVDRSTLYAIQTPQSFSVNILFSSLALANKQGKDFTDDCQLIENAGGKVFMIEGSYDNIKITTVEDLNLAHIISQKSDEDYI